MTELSCRFLRTGIEQLVIINSFFTYASLALFIIAVLTAILVFVISVALTILALTILALTILALLIACSVLEISVMWYYGAGALILGIVVAYAAMGNFDKLKEVVERLQAYKSAR